MPTDPTSERRRGGCNCESSYCDHDRMNLACPNPPHPDVRMEFVGPICVECAQLIVATGGACYISDQRTPRVS